LFHWHDRVEVATPHAPHSICFIHPATKKGDKTAREAAFKHSEQHPSTLTT
jgi:hypothetical protein